MAKLSILAVSLTIFLTGCGFPYANNKHLPYPVAKDRPFAHQEKLQAAAHWDTLAANEADEILKTIGTTSISFHDQEEPNTDFGKAYKTLLTGHLLDKNIQVLDSGGGHFVKFKVQVVSHVNRDSLGLPAGSMTALTAGVLLASASQHWSTPGIAAIPIALAADGISQESKDGKTTDTEVLITTELYHLDEIVQSSTRIYYFNEGNEFMYVSPPIVPEPEPNPDRSFKVTNQS